MKLGQLVVPRSLIAPAAILVLLFAIHLPSYLHYVPNGDDPAVLQASAGHPLAWFTQGFSQYFAVYPGWAVELTDFVRPGVNLILFCEQLLAGQHYVVYFIVFYLAQLLLCWISVLIARQIGLSEKLQAIVALLIAVNPAFIATGMLNIAFQFDVWCGLFVLLALYWLLRGRYAWTIVALTMAVFTKEMALYAPIAACLSVYWRTRRKGLAAWMLAPLAAWLLVRRFLFTSGTDIYVFFAKSKLDYLRDVMERLSVWPTGVAAASAIPWIGIPHMRLAGAMEALMVLVNLLLWLVLATVAISLLRSLRAGASVPGDAARGVLLLWLCGALSIGVLAATSFRFGGSIYPLDVLFFASLCQYASPRPGRLLAAASLVLLAAGFGLHLVHQRHTVLTRAKMDAEQRQMRALLDALHRYGAHADRVYVLNSVMAGSNPASLAAEAHISTKVVVLNEYIGCPRSPDSKNTIMSTVNSVHLSATIPACAQLFFLGVYPTLFEHALPGSVSWPGVATYTFPYGRIPPGPRRYANLFMPDFGREIDVEISTSPSVANVYLWYDWGSGTYQCAGPLCSASSAAAAAGE